jgi:hypothetical protein
MALYLGEQYVEVLAYASSSQSNVQIIYLGATASWHMAINAGLGKPLTELDTWNVERYFKVKIPCGS